MIYPQHLSIIPDWNRTRSLANGVSLLDGYIKSVDKGVELIKHVFTNTWVKILSWRWMSTENRKKRPVEELHFLFNMYKTCGDLLNDFLLEHKINFRRIGDPDTLPQDFLQYMTGMVNKFTFDSDRTLIFAVNYGWQNEIIRWVKKYVSLWNDINNLNEQNLGQYLDLGSFPPVELVVRTKWEKSSRISGFMSWWIWYAELYFEPKLFQDVETRDIDKGLTRFDSIAGNRNFGA